MPRRRRKLERGKRIVELFKQPQYNPMPVEVQVAVLWAVQNGFVDDVAGGARSRMFQAKLTDFLTTRKPELLQRDRQGEGDQRRADGGAEGGGRPVQATAGIKSMPSTRDIRRRIKSVKNTAQITKAMQMVAASKMRKAQQAALEARPYADAADRDPAQRHRSRPPASSIR